MKKYTILFLFCISSFLNAKVWRAYSTNNLPAIINNVSPGDTVLFINGTWQDQYIYFKAKGTQAKPIVVKAETPGKVIVKGNSRFRITGEHLIISGFYFKDGYIIPTSESDFILEIGFKDLVGGEWITGNNIRLTECAIENYNPPDSSQHHFWVVLRGNNNRVDHCFFKGKKHFGNMFVVAGNIEDHHNRIDSNYFGPRPPNVINGQLINGADIIMVGYATDTGGSSNTIEYNYFEECNGEDEIISNKSNDNIYRNNVFARCTGFISLRWGKRAIVEGNYFFGQHNISGGISILSENHKIYNNYFESLQGNPAVYLLSGDFAFPATGSFPQVKNVEIVHNTFVNNQINFHIGRNYLVDPSLPPKPPLNCLIANNIVYRSYYDSSNPYIFIEREPINLVWEKNIMFGSPIGAKPAQGVDEVNPKLKQAYPDFLWRLDSNSPAINSSSRSFSYVVDDFDGQLRNGNHDIGCDEYSTSPIMRAPIDKKKTGPRWMHELSTCVNEEPEIKTEFVLFQNYPNPFNPSTVICYRLSVFSKVSLKVYDLLGKEVATLVNEEQQPGVYYSQFSIRNMPANMQDSQLSSGVYFYRLSAGGKSTTKKLILIR